MRDYTIMPMDKSYDAYEDMDKKKYWVIEFTEVVRRKKFLVTAHEAQEIGEMWRVHKEIQGDNDEQS